MQYRARTEAGVNSFIFFFRTMRTLLKFMPAVFLTREGADDWSNAVMDFLLRADDLIAPTNLLRGVESTFTWNYHAICICSAQ